MRPRPIFDTNIFGHVQDGSIPERDWRFVLRRRPGHGWPLSAVTALELLAGIHDLPAEKFLEVKRQIELAYNLSSGRILEEPRFLLCKEVLRIPFPPYLIPPSAKVLARYMDVARHANSRAEILERRVQYKRFETQGKGRAGFGTLVLKDLVAGPKNEWVERSEAFASEIYPEWREHYRKTGKRLPDEMRKGLESRPVWDAEKAKFAESTLKWLGARTSPELVAEITKKLDAVLSLTVFVICRFLLGNYNLEKHESDVYDQFQLHYLAMDRFVLVSEDRNLLVRTARSSQSDRILSFDRFLQSL